MAQPMLSLRPLLQLNSEGAKPTSEPGLWDGAVVEQAATPGGSCWAGSS